MNKNELISQTENLSSKKILCEKQKELLYFKQQNENLIDKMTNLVKDFANRKKGKFNFFILEKEVLLKKKKDLETENYVLNYLKCSIKWMT